MGDGVFFSSMSLKSQHLYPTFPIVQRMLPALPGGRLPDYSSLDRARDLLDVLDDKTEGRGLVPAELTVVGLIGKAVLQVLDRYQQDLSPRLLADFEEALSLNLRSTTLSDLLHRFLRSYPHPDVSASPANSLEEHLAGRPVKHLLLPTLILAVLAAENNAFRPYRPLLTSPDFHSSPGAADFLGAAESFFAHQPPLENQNLLDFLRGPYRAHPDSIFAQLQFILDRWHPYLEEDFRQDLARGLDFIRESHRKSSWGKAPPAVPDFSALSGPGGDQRSFSPDSDWMPQVVLLAKNAYVWLDQLSQAYGKDIHTLDQIPDRELSKLRSWGITSLWLIGIWERSPASKKIKQLCGNPEAAASAYSLYDYTISPDLGGHAAYQDLHTRANAQGIRLAADMVPNHMGLDSKWVQQHPDWFLSLGSKPYPAYSYQGPDLSSQPDISLYLEDHYYDKTDAAVVFKRVDHGSGETRYLYHGNDGTAMPWNDTAQLNFLKPEVREAVSDAILKVAEMFSVIRFDAAMTLAKRHYQRLWFPAPGTGGAIPSRSEHGLTEDEFNQLFPREFWRDVVDRISEEAPDTLLLAEAFWMMEGYFVRTLGMHRVYNSAFMNMLKAEDNQKYRSLIKETLSFDPEILKRYVNFMNNPDEDTALAQFGKGGKYFGICLLMATLPGLPMFGHGQIEGYSEKYGMEYRQAYLDEQPDQELIDRHKREIFPLLRKRYLFAGVKNFVLFDFLEDGGQTNQDVFAYTNRSGEESALIVYHNTWGDTTGRIHTPAPVHPPELTLARSLGLELQVGAFLAYRDVITDQHHLLPAHQVLNTGLSFELGAYQYHVLTDFRQLTDQDGALSQLSRELGGKGVPDLEAALDRVYFQDLSSPLTGLIEADNLARLFPSVFTRTRKTSATKDTSDQPSWECSSFYRELFDLPDKFLTARRAEPEQISRAVKKRLEIIREGDLLDSASFPDPTREEVLPAYLFAVFFPLTRMIKPSARTRIISLLPDLCERTHPQLAGERIALMLRCLLDVLDHQTFPARAIPSLLAACFSSEHGREYLYVHEYQGKSYFQQEAFVSLNTALFLLSENTPDRKDSAPELPGESPERLFDGLTQAARSSGYQVEPFLDALASSELDHS